MLTLNMSRKTEGKKRDISFRTRDYISTDVSIKLIAEKTRLL